MTVYVPDDVHQQVSNLQDDMSNQQLSNLANVKAAAKSRDYKTLLAWLEDPANRQKFIRGALGEGFEPLSERAKDV